MIKEDGEIIYGEFLRGEEGKKAREFLKAATIDFVKYRQLIPHNRVIQSQQKGKINIGPYYTIRNWYNRGMKNNLHFHPAGEN